MPPLQLTLACFPYDRIAALIDGRVKIDGCDMTYFPVDAEEAFHRAFAAQDFDITELSASSHILATARNQAQYCALPIFISRVFRHSAIYIRTDRGISKPQDMRGRIVGVPEFQMTAALWARGLLSDEYGVATRDMRWRSGGLNKPGREERTPISPPPEIEVKVIPTDRTLSEMLEAGEIDALVTARAPDCFTKNAPNVGRLFPDFRKAEEEYFQKTGLFPIMHLIAIRRSLIEQHRWLAGNVLKAFYAAKEITVHEMEDIGVLSATLPWLADDLARARRIMGQDFWPYGVPENRKAIDCMLRWSYEQGLSHRQVNVDELFAPGTLAKFLVKD